MIEMHWVVVDNMIVFQVFNSIAELGFAKLLQAVTQNLGVGLLSDIFRISDFF